MQLALGVFSLAVSVTLALTISCHVVENVAMHFHARRGQILPRKRHKSSEEKGENIQERVKKAPVSTVREGVT